MDPPDDLLNHVYKGGMVEAHNVGFEHAIWNHVGVKRHGWPRLAIHQENDTMALAARAGLPLALKGGAKALRLPELKDDSGSRLLTKLSKPRKPTKKDPDTKWNEDFEDLQALYDYCAQDVRTEQALSARLGHFLPADERKVWELDQRINMRGVRIDLEAARAGVQMVEAVSEEINEEFRELTGVNVTQRDKFLGWLADQGHPLDNTQGDTVEEALQAPALPAGVRRALELHKRSSKASNNKLRAMLAVTCSDGRARRLLQYHGATTGRWAGRLIQPQNFPRPEGVFEKYTQADVAEALDLIRQGDAELIDMIHGDVLEMISNCLRGFLTCDKDRALVSADLAGIENRVVAALGGEKWKLDAFRRIDDGLDRDIYCQTADTIFGYRIEGKDTHPGERFVGKICELAFGFQGGVGAWRQFDSSDKHTDEDVEYYKERWRANHPGIKDLWRNLDTAAIGAVYRKRPHSCGPFEFKLEDEWLTCRLPSGRKLWYFAPQVKTAPAPWDPEDTVLRLSFMQQRDGQWKRVSTYGGRLAENVTQAVARDIMVVGMFNAEAAGYPCILTVHDELVTEPWAGGADHKVLEECMCDMPAWVRELDIPVAAEGWTGERYWK
jgi:DNA polymerase